MHNFNINEKGYWETENIIGHVHDDNLCQNIIKFLIKNNVKNVFDFGCGLGDYASSIISSGINCEAYDGNLNTKILSKGLANVLDLSESFDLQKKYDCVLSLEVGEHIPKEYEQIFLDNICKHTNNLLILSWAIVGQVGDGHVNCQNNDYIINQISNRGFIYDIQNSLELRASATCAPWFKNTILFFKK